MRDTGHQWKLEVYHTDGSNKLTFADGDDVTVTEHLGLASEPRFVQERNQPRYLEFRINNPYAIAAWNVLSSSFSLWSNGLAAKLGPGMHVRYYVTDDETGTESRVFQGRIRSPPTSDDNGVVTVTAYDELMVLGETRDPYVVFNSMRDRAGDSKFAGGPDIYCLFNSQNQIIATLPDANIVQPLTKLMLAEPQDYNDSTDGAKDGVGHSEYAYDLMAMVAQANQFYSITVMIENQHLTDDATVTGYLFSAVWDGSKYAVGSLLASSAGQTASHGTGYLPYRFILPYNIQKGSVYYFGWGTNSANGNAKGAASYIGNALNDQLYNALYSGGWIYNSVKEYPQLQGGVSPLALKLQYLQEREIPSGDYKLTQNAGSADLIVAQGSSPINTADLGAHGRFIRATYFYGKLTVPQVMITLAQRAGFTASIAGSFSPTAQLPVYNTGNYTYLECLRELADLYDAGLARQFVFAADVSGNLGDKTLEIGLRYKPWSDGISAYTFSDLEEDVETSSLLKCIAPNASLKNHFEAKVGTQRMVSRAADGSPIAIETDDRLWSYYGSLVLQTGSPMQDIGMDSTFTTLEQLAAASEAVVREQHQNHVEGSLPLSRRLPSLLNMSPSSSYYGQSTVFGITSRKAGLTAYPAVATKLTIQGGTVLELDNQRVSNVSNIKRSMDKAMASESFSISSLPDTVYIHVRYNNTLPSTTGWDRIVVHRYDGYNLSTLDMGTAIKVIDDYCGPSGGYRHAVGYFPGGKHNSLSCYHYSGGTSYLYPISWVAFGNGSSWIYCYLDRPVYAWHHQAILVDIRGPR